MSLLEDPCIGEGSGPAVKASLFVFSREGEFDLSGICGEVDFPLSDSPLETSSELDEDMGFLGFGSGLSSFSPLRALATSWNFVPISSENEESSGID